MTDNAAVVIGEHSYWPFGAELTGGSQPREGVLRFTGHERDQDVGDLASSGSDYMHARYYSPSMGRFFTIDPVLAGRIAMRNPQGWNRYSYAYNNPQQYVDPNGRCAFRMADGSWSFDDSIICHETTADGSSSKASQAAAANSALREAELWGQAEVGVANAGAVRNMGQYYARRMYEGLVPQGTFVFGLSGAVIFPLGGEASAGFALNTDVDSESHADATLYLGAGVGLDVGIGVYFGWVPGELSQVPGSTTNATGSVLQGSMTAIMDNQGRRIGNIVTIGESVTPISASGTQGTTWCLFGCR